MIIPIIGVITIPPMPMMMLREAKYRPRQDKGTMSAESEVHAGSAKLLNASRETLRKIAIYTATGPVNNIGKNTRNRIANRAIPPPAITVIHLR